MGSNRGVTPHDEYFKYVFGDKEVVESFVKNFLPEKIYEGIDFKGHFNIGQLQHIDESLKEYLSDIVWVGTNQCAELTMLFLFEHKSYPDKRVYIQLLGYMASILQQNRKSKTLPQVVPILIYHGQKGWNPKKIRELYPEAPEEFLKMIPDFEICFVNINKLNDAQLLTLGNVYLALALAALSNTKDENSFDRANHLLMRFKETALKLNLNENFINMTIVYLIKKSDFSGNIGRQKIEIMQEIANQPRKRRKSTWDHLFEEAVEKGMEKGMEKGIEKGKAQGVEEGMGKLILNAYEKLKDPTIVADLLGVEKDLVLKILNKK